MMNIFLRNVQSSIVGEGLIQYNISESQQQFIAKFITITVENIDEIDLTVENIAL